MSILADVNGYSELVSYYEANKSKNWNEWLSFDTVFDKPGKQGLVGLLDLKNKEGKKRKYVFKISQYINYLIHHESIVMKGLNELAPYCPHFCKSVGNIICKVDPRSRKEGNPFNIDAKYPIQKEALLCEFIDKSCKFYNYIRAVDRITEDVLYSAMKQVLMAISIAQRKKRFTHYDLHSFNIMMRKCNKDVVFLYVLDEENQFAIPTYGHYPVIIDFGFSYISDMDDGPLWTSLAHTDVGFMSDRFDWVADPKLFLVTVSGEIKEKRNSKRAHRLRRVVRNLFHPLDIDWDSGWDEGEEQGAADYITEMLSDYNPGSLLFDDYEHYCVDLVQSMIILPLEEQDYSEIHKSYVVFVKEWTKIENQISSPFYNLYILKGIVDAARHVRAGYMRQNTRLDAIRNFRHQVHDRIAEVANFCKLENLHFERMLCSLLIFSRCIEGVLYDVITARMAEKEYDYSKLPLQSTEQIYASIEVNIPDKYVYNENTTVFVFDTVKQNTGMLKLTPEQTEIINEITPICRGTSLYDIYTGIAPV
jgi:hypothetical protein